MPRIDVRHAGNMDTGYHWRWDVVLNGVSVACGSARTKRDATWAAKAWLG